MKLVVVMISVALIAFASGAMALYHALASKWQPKNRVAASEQEETT